ncbi:hypothetical protein E2C01_025560 [Portunus trituberculatus]|uniref:Uncharacterized protein n=1 Tax=Portunus trituberculatus TaxID=210409 RepID=A0A5B7EGS0_PORTR|nr:hypothetical protein [Portunus trituberculatus]
MRARWTLWQPAPVTGNARSVGDMTQFGSRLNIVHQEQLHFRVGGAGVPAHVGLLREAQPTDRAGKGSLPCVGVHVVFKVVTLAKQPLTNWARVAQARPSSSTLQEKPRPHSLIFQTTTTTTALGCSLCTTKSRANEVLI